MSDDVVLATRERGEAALPREQLDWFRSGLRGRVILRGDADYDEARAVWNAMIDRRPGMIVRCAGTADVMRSVRFAREHDLLVAVRGGGHNIAGSALCEGGVVIDLGAMREVHVDPRRRIARVAGGARLADCDAETQAFGLATPLGINSTTGIAGLTLGGGFGWLTRKYGLTIDNLLSAEVVLASGDVALASEESEPDLFWAIRGGGGNFGVVTSFDFRLHAVGPELLCGLIVHRLEDARAVIDPYRRFVAGMPDELSCWLVLRKAPPLPFLPADMHGREMLALAVVYAGDIDEGARVLEPLRRVGRPVADAVAPQPYVAWQQVLDPLLAPRARNYWKSHNFAALEDGAVDVMLDYAARLPSPHTEIFLGQLGGAAGRVAPEAMAYPHRDANFVLNVHGRWQDARDDRRCIAWAREFFQATAPYATGGVYVNFISEGEDRVRAAFGRNYERLAALKARFDPLNMFRTNQNIAPAPRAEETEAPPPGV